MTNRSCNRPGLESPLSKVVSSTVLESWISFLACSLVRNCKKRLGLMPTQRLNRRWQWNSLQRAARATS